MYFLGLLVWLGGVLFAHIAWRLCFVQTTASVVSAETYQKKYRNITHTNIVIAYSYVFNEKKYEDSDSQIGGDSSSIDVEKIVPTTKSFIPIYVNRFNPKISYVDLFWGTVWPLLAWFGVILALPTAYVVRFF